MQKKAYADFKGVSRGKSCNSAEEPGRILKFCRRWSLHRDGKAPEGFLPGGCWESSRLNFAKACNAKRHMQTSKGVSRGEPCNSAGDGHCTEMGGSQRAFSPRGCPESSRLNSAENAKPPGGRTTARQALWEKSSMHVCKTGNVPRWQDCKRGFPQGRPPPPCNHTSAILQRTLSTAGMEQHRRDSLWDPFPYH